MRTALVSLELELFRGESYISTCCKPVSAIAYALSRPSTSLRPRQHFPGAGRSIDSSCRWIVTDDRQQQVEMNFIEFAEKGKLAGRNSISRALSQLHLDVRRPIEIVLICQKPEKVVELFFSSQ